MLFVEKFSTGAMSLDVMLAKGKFNDVRCVEETKQGVQPRSPWLQQDPMALPFRSGRFNMECEKASNDALMGGAMSPVPLLEAPSIEDEAEDEADTEAEAEATKAGPYYAKSLSMKPREGPASPPRTWNF